MVLVLHHNLVYPPVVNAFFSLFFIKKKPGSCQGRGWSYEALLESLHYVLLHSPVLWGGQGEQLTSRQNLVGKQVDKHVNGEEAGWRYASC